MSGFVHREAEESDSEIEDELDPHERKKLKKLKAMSDSEEEEEEDDEDKIREELKDLIDDNPIEEDESDAESDSSRPGNAKRKKSDDEDDELDDRLEDEDYDLIEENLGVKVERKRFKRLKRITDEESDTEERDESLTREVLADQLFVGGSDEEDDRRSERSRRIEPERYDEEMSDESDADDFIVDDYGVSIAEKKRKRKPVFTDAALQEGQDIFGVDFDYNEFDAYDEDEYEDESADEDEYEDEDREKRTKKSSRKKVQKKSIFDIYEPSELKRGHFTDMDNIIRKTDIPERMQLRDVPIQSVPEGSSELDDEAEWIYRQAFAKKPISQISNEPLKMSSAIIKIKKTLDFIRNQHLEVPFIHFYRKEYVEAELRDPKDLWKVYKFDARWCVLQNRKKALLQLFEKIRDFQLEQIADKPDNDVPEDMVLIRDDDIDRLRHVQTPEELRDIHDHFLLHCGADIEGWKNIERQKKSEKSKETRDEKIRERKEQLHTELKELQASIEDEPTEEEEERLQSLKEELERLELGEDVEMDEENTEKPDEVKVSRNSGPYARCRKAGICRFAKLFGLTPEQFAENLRDGYQRHEVEQVAKDPLELAKDYTSTHFTTVEDVMSAAKFVVARQLAREPLLRKTVREIFYERAKVCVRPTKKGLKEIDEFHPCFTLKYLKNKPVSTFKNDEYLRLKIAEQDKLLTVTINENFEGNSTGSYLEEVKQLYNCDEFAQHVQNWNEYRFQCVEIALTKMVLPDLRKELDSILLAEAKEYVSEACARKIRDWIKIAPYEAADIFDENDYEWETSKGIRVMGLAYVPDFSQAAFGVIVNHDGEVTDYLRLPHILKRKNSNNKDDKTLKENDLENLAEFLRNKKPHVIAIGGESREALMLQADLREVIDNLVKDDKFPEINVEIVDNDFAKIYANSKKAETDFRDYPLLLRQAISIARRLRDPLVEFSQLCSADEEILCLRYHTLQDQLSKEELADIVYTEFINQTNEVGVDINLAVQNPLTMNLVQFICGLGPRKGQALIKILKQTNQRLENRTQLVTSCHMGPKVFINCSGFIKIDTNSLGDSTESYVEVLDGSRVHPETYEWARKMAVDALEYDDDGANPAGALEEILENPDKLKDLDLDAFAQELERTGFGNKSITLYDIREELESRYRDKRMPYEPPSKEVLFDMLTKESAETFYTGKMVSATVTGISHRKPSNEQLDGADPTRDPETGLWTCPFCARRDFNEISDVWEHFDNNSCYGTAVGVKLRLENGLNGFIVMKNLSDKHVKNPEDRVRQGMPIHVRVKKIDIEKFNVDCTSKTSDLVDKLNEHRPTRDDYYDYEAEDTELKKETEAKKIKSRQQYTKRVISHPSFHNISYADAVKLLEKMDQGDVIIRPSSKGTDHLTVTWKVADDVYQHVDVREVGKENNFSLGTSLFIGTEEFEDLDEIIARYINPIAGFARDLIAFKYYRRELGGLRDKAEELLKEEKRKNANKIHYFISASKNYPGKFMISYQPRANCKHEYISVTSEGFKFRQQMFDNINALMKWFKDHYKDPIPAPTPSTPRGGSSTRSYSTPGLSVHNEAIQRVAQNLPSHMFNSLAQATNTTPHYPQANTPYTPSGQTPFLAFTPHSSQTPHQYGQMTPTQHGQFLRPGAPVSRQPATYRASPFTATASPRTMQHPREVSRRAQSQEDEDWDRASSAWGKGGTPRGDSMGRSTPRGSKPSRDEYQPKRTPQYEMERPSSRTSVRSTSGRSVRTDTSPHSIMIDSTPLYDE